MKLDKGKIAVLLGGLTLVLFASKPYILDLIEPSKSIGQRIGENAKDLINAIRDEQHFRRRPTTTRELWSNILTVVSFISFAATIIYSISAAQLQETKWFAIGAFVLACIGLGIYIMHIAIGLIAILAIGVLALAIVTAGGI